MGLAQYSIVARGEQWAVLHDEGHEVHLSVPGREEGEAALTKSAR